MASRDLLRRVLTDPKLRSQLASDPAKVLGPGVTPAEIVKIRRILSQVRGLEEQISALASEVLCGGGGCGIA
jgi:hypothetical protein